MEMLERERDDLAPHLLESFLEGAFEMSIESAVEYDARVLALPTHTPACLAALRTSYDARQSYIARWPFYCQQCHGTGEVEVESGHYEDPPVSDLCPACVRQTICPRCGLTFAVRSDGSEPCHACGFDFEDGLPERAYCTCGADRALYEGQAVFLPDFPE